MTDENGVLTNNVIGINIKNAIFSFRNTGWQVLTDNDG